MRADLTTATKTVPLQGNRHLALSSNDDQENGQQTYSQKQLLKEETEAPFRKIRFFTYLSIALGAGVGSLVSFTGLLASSVKGISNGGDDLYNLGINLGLIAITAVLWNRDIKSQDALLDRIQKGGKLAGLKVRLNEVDGPLVVKLADLRRDRGIEKRVVIVAAPQELLSSSLESAVKQSASLAANDLLMVPLQIERSDERSAYTLRIPAVSDIDILTGEGSTRAQFDSVVALPSGIDAWNDAMRAELSVAIKQQPEVLNRGITIVIKKNGKVGTRRFGVPIWESIVDDVEARRGLGLDVTNI